MNNTLVAAIILGGLYVTGQYVASLPAYEEQAVEAGRQITVTGEATLSSQPDVAKITLGVTTQPQQTAEAALSQVSESFNRIVEVLDELDIPEEDIKTTNFNLNPQYDFVDGRQQLRGYVASEQVIVTVRDFSNVGSIISQSTQVGANQVGNVVFEIDEDSELRAQAEEAAIEDARDKAEGLAGALGANLGPVLSYSMGGGQQPPTPYAARTLELDAASGEAPVLPPGTNESTITATITFGLR